MHLGQRFFKTTLAKFCKSKKCIIFNIDKRPGSKKSKFKMTLLSDSPFEEVVQCDSRDWMLARQFSLLLFTGLNARKAILYRVLRVWMLAKPFSLSLVIHVREC